jgi:hypothetical protein
MFISRKTAAWIAGTALAITLPFFSGLAQQPQAPDAARGRGGSGGGQGGFGGGGDYNSSLRTPADKALPNPYWRNETFFKVPLDRVLGSSSAIATDKDGKSIWVAERCGAQSSGDQNVYIHSTVNPVMKFDETGKMVKMFGTGQIVYLHSLTVDKDGNIWVADLQSNVDRPVRGGGRNGAAPAAPAPVAPGPALTPNGNQIIKYDTNGKILMHLLVPGVYGIDNALFSQPSAVAIEPNGDFFVADGHDSAPSNRMYRQRNFSSRAERRECSFAEDRRIP